MYIYTVVYIHFCDNVVVFCQHDDVFYDYDIPQQQQQVHTCPGPLDQAQLTPENKKVVSI